MTQKPTFVESRVLHFEDKRSGPPFMAGDRESLESWLEFYRQTLPVKLSGLTASQLCQASMPPSSLTLIGLLRHLTEVERYWFSNIALGTDQQPPYGTDENPDGDFNAYSEETAFADVQAYLAELEAVREHAASIADLDMAVAGQRRGQPLNLRWIYTHLIEEYARHLGHVDFLREGIDGVAGY